MMARMWSAGSNGPTITLIKDKQGHVFGGFSADPWERHGTFYGDSLLRSMALPW